MLQRLLKKVLPDPYYTATAGQVLRSGANTTPVWSTPTFPNTATANKVLVGDGTNIVLATATIPITSAPGAGVILQGDGTNWIASTPTWPTAAGSAKNVPRSDGTNFVSAQLAASDLSNGTSGSGAIALVSSCVLITPALGTPSSGTLTSCTGLPIGGGTTGTLATNRGGTGVTGSSVGAASGVALADTGTFTPTVVGSTSAGTGTYTNQQGNYTRVADRCFFNLRVTWSATTGTGNLLIGGFPFTSNTGANTHNTLTIWFNGNVALETGYAALIVPNDTRAFIYGYQSGTGVGNLALPATGDIVLAGSYLL